MATALQHSASWTEDKMVTHYLTILLLAAAVAARSTQEVASEDNILGDLKVAYDTYKDCGEKDMFHCLKRKLAKSLTRLSKSEEISLLNGVTITRNEGAVEKVEEEAIPRGLDESSLDNLILDKIVGFMQTHTIQVKFPSSEELARSYPEERGRRKKLAPLLAIPLLIGGMMVPLAFGALALLAGKALIVSKLALVLAGIIGLKKLLSSSGSGEAHEVVVSAGHGGAGWSRSMESSNDLAYNAYKPQ